MQNSQTNREDFVSVIVPAHNEERRIHITLDVVTRSGLVDEVLVVSDGSTDKTAEVAKDYPKVRVLELKQNVGKGKAMEKGVSEAYGDIIFFLDADLRGLREEHIRGILEPVKRREVVMCTASREKETPEKSYFCRRHLTHIAGERAMRRFVWQQVPKFFKRRYMIETSLNAYCRFKNQPVGDVFCPGLGIEKKEQKWGKKIGKSSRRKLYWDIIWAHILLFANPIHIIPAIRYKKITRYKPWIFPEKGA